MTGFMVPLEFDGMKVSEFLLVPIAGACIHTPPLPSNQMVLVTAKTPVDDIDLYAPITVEGELRVRIYSMSITYSDGVADASSGYWLLADRTIAPYDPIDESIFAIRKESRLIRISLQTMYLKRGGLESGMSCSQCSVTFFH